MLVVLGPTVWVDTSKRLSVSRRVKCSRYTWVVWEVMLRQVQVLVDTAAAERAGARIVVATAEQAVVVQPILRIMEALRWW